MAQIIEMPKLSDTMTVGTLVNWLKQEGDTVEPGDMLAEVETDKATMELENFEEGVLLKQYAKAGDQIEIGKPICAIGEAGETAPEAPVGNSEDAPSAEEQVAAEEKAAAAPEAPVEVDADAGEAEGSDHYREVDESILAEREAESRIKASPLARKIAIERGISLRDITGTGPGGRIIKEDVFKAIEDQKAQAKKAKGAEPAFSPPGSGAPIQEDVAVPVSNMRGAIARRLVESKTTVPHFYLETTVDAAPLLKLRAEVNSHLSELPVEQGGGKLSVNDFILRATVKALRRVPAVNASWMGDTIQKHGAIHLAFGVAIEDGLLTPVIRDAHGKGVRQISLEAKELIGKARNRKLKPDEMSGSTFTVTNLGMYGITSFYGIINPPNAGILSVGATESRALIDPKTGEVKEGQMMRIGFSGDHRVVDGATGAEFLTALRTIIETPPLMLV